MRWLVALALTGCWSSGPNGTLWRPTGALTGGVHATGSSETAAVTGTGGYGELEGGGREDRFGFVGFARFAQFRSPGAIPDEVAYVDRPTSGGDSMRTDNFSLGVRFHTWPFRWWRLSASLGELTHHETDAAGAMPDVWRYGAFVSLGTAFVLYQGDGAQLELGVDVSADELARAAASLGIGVRI
jgi:hypothetical protein